MNVVDSSGWLEFFANAPNADFFAEPLASPTLLVVPVISVYEVFKRVLQQCGEDQALQAVALMQQGTLVDVDLTLALLAARLAVEHRLPLADSLIYATGRIHGATVWTQDGHFEGLPDVRYRAKPKVDEVPPAASI